MSISFSYVAVRWNELVRLYKEVPEEIQWVEEIGTNGSYNYWSLVTKDDAVRLPHVATLWKSGMDYHSQYGCYILSIHDSLHHIPELEPLLVSREEMMSRCIGKYSVAFEKISDGVCVHSLYRILDAEDPYNISMAQILLGERVTKLVRHDNISFLENLARGLDCHIISNEVAGPLWESLMGWVVAQTISKEIPPCPIVTMLEFNGDYIINQLNQVVKEDEEYSRLDVLKRLDGDIKERKAKFYGQFGFSDTPGWRNR